MLRSVNEESAEGDKKRTTLYSLRLVHYLIQNLKRSFIFLMSWMAQEGILVASKIADRVGITRSVNCKCSAQV